MTKLQRTAVGLAHQDAPVKDRQWVQELLDDWLSTKARTTLNAYRRDFEDFATRVGGAGADPNAVLSDFLGSGEDNGHRIALQYKAELMRSVAPRTVNRRLASLRSLVTLARVGWTLGVRGVKVAAIKDTSGVSRDAYLAMCTALEGEIATAKTNGASPLRPLRDLAVLHLWHDMALRRGSVCGLDVEDVDLQRRQLHVLLKGKGDEKNWRPCPRPTCGILKRYLGTRGRDPGPLFYSLSNRARGRRLQPTSYNKILTRIVEIANADPANPHKFRHTAITRALNLGVPVRDVAAFSGHADIRTVMIYDDNRGMKARSVAELVAGEDEIEDEDEGAAEDEGDD